MNTPLLHVLGGGPWQVPTIRLAKSMGLRVLVTDYFKDRPGYQYADAHEVVDITDMSAILDVARHYKISGIICDTTDVGVPTAAYVAEHMGLPGMSYEVALNFTNKARMRELARQHGISVPNYFIVHDTQACKKFINRINSPVIVKPVDSQSGKGITLVGQGSELPQAVQYALDNSKTRTAIIESVVSGQEFIVDSFMLDGHAVILGIAEKIPHRLQLTVSERITYRPLDEYRDALPRIQQVNQIMLQSMGLRWGIAHAEYIFDGDVIIPIDIAARGGGCMIYTHVLPYISQVNVNQEMIKLAIGREPVVNPGMPMAANIEFFHIREGTIEAWLGIEDALRTKGLLGIHFNIKPGVSVPAIRNKDHRAGYILTGANSADEAITAGLSAKARLRARLRDQEQDVAVI